MSLSFDRKLGNLDVSAILNYLEQTKLNATFHFVGTEVAKNQGLVQKIKLNHTVGLKVAFPADFPCDDDKIKGYFKNQSQPFYDAIKTHPNVVLVTATNNKLCVEKAMKDLGYFNNQWSVMPETAESCVQSVVRDVVLLKNVTGELCVNIDGIKAFVANAKSLQYSFVNINDCNGFKNAYNSTIFDKKGAATGAETETDKNSSEKLSLSLLFALFIMITQI